MAPLEELTIRVTRLQGCFSVSVITPAHPNGITNRAETEADAGEIAAEAICDHFPSADEAPL